MPICSKEDHQAHFSHMTMISRADSLLLYDLFFLLQLLAPARDVLPSSTTSRSKTKSANSAEKNFLDYLAFLIECDAVVPSIAVQKASNGAPRYWVATNNISKRGQCVDFLNKLLKMLSVVDFQDDSSRQMAWREISLLAMNNCKAVRRFYSRLVKIHEIIEGKARSTAEISSDQRRVLRYLSDEVIQSDNITSACWSAYSMRDGVLKQCLTNIVAQKGVDSDWNQLRHYIGRLTAWIKAAKIVVSYCKNNTSSISGFEVAACPTFACHEHNEMFTESRLTTVLESLETEYPVDQLRQFLIDLKHPEHGNFLTYLKNSVENLTIKRLLHSEIGLLEHFLGWNYEFWTTTAYIGCSKRSCFGCSHYLDCRSEGRITRASHGNAYMAWGLIRFKSSNERAMNSYKRTFEHVLWSAKQCLLRKITQGGQWSRKQTDSTTGFGTITASL